MRIPDDHVLRLTHALLCEDTAVAAAAALRGRPERAVREGLVELLLAPPSARAALAALAALEAMARGWDPVMVRHSAAHRGTETEVFPQALAHGTSLLTFNNTCYGRLLQPHGALPAPSAADCYRYTLAQPAVTACLSAPATLAQLEENLSVLHEPTLPPERRERLLAQGDRVYREDTIFKSLVREP